jgi:hypothetical protein
MQKSLSLPNFRKVNCISAAAKILATSLLKITTPCLLAAVPGCPEFARRAYALSTPANIQDEVVRVRQRAGRVQTSRN